MTDKSKILHDILLVSNPMEPFVRRIRSKKSDIPRRTISAEPEPAACLPPMWTKRSYGRHRRSVTIETGKRPKAAVHEGPLRVQRPATKAESPALAGDEWPECALHSAVPQTDIVRRDQFGRMKLPARAPHLRYAGQPTDAPQGCQLPIGS